MELNFAPKNTFEENELEVLRSLANKLVNACAEVSSCEMCPLHLFKDSLNNCECAMAYDILLECLGV